ncbi:MAG: IPT/TIG domain-containing protein [Candidatus Acidiferrales bacterium]
MQVRSRVFLWISICLSAALLTACQEQINYPTPSQNITLSPASISAGQPGFTLTVHGGNLTPASTVYWNGTPLVTLFTSISELTAQVPATLIQNAGSASVVVTTPSPGGGTTLAAIFTINATSSPLPKITSLSPSGASAGGSGFTLTINGSNFVSQSEVSVNGNLRPAGGTATSLSTTITAADIATAGTVPIVVVNPAPAGGTSNTMNLNVTNPVPSLGSLSPATAAAGTTTATAVTVAGAGFVSNSTVLINGAPRATVFGNSGSLQVNLTAGDLAQGSVDQVQVFSPGPGGGTSNILTFAVDPTESAGLPVLVDIADSGVQANNGVCGTPCTSGVPTLTTAGPATSSTGEFIAFASTSTNLLWTVTQQNLTNGTSGIFFRDTCLSTTTSSGTACTPKTTLLTTGIGGGPANGPSSEPSLDSGAANVAFTSTATNLVSYVSTPGSTSQVYWQPTCQSTTTSCTPVLVSLSADQSSAGNGASYNPVISPDGQYVAFVSLATNLVSGIVVDGVTPQVYIRTICAGATPATQTTSCVPTTYLVSTPDGITPGNKPSSDPAISNAGLYVSFASTATNLGATAPNPNGAQEIFERSTCVTTIGSSVNSCVPITNLVSSPDGGATAANGASTEPAISPDGRFVAFASTATDFGIASAGVQQVYVYDTCIGVVVTTPATCSPSSPMLVSTPDTATTPVTPGNALSENPSVSVCNATTTTEGTCPGGVLIAFSTKSTNLSPNVVNGVENVFVRSTCADLPSGTTACIPRTALASQPAGASAAANGDSIVPALSGDGHTVSFISAANNLVAIDSNGLPDIFLAATSF